MKSAATAVISSATQNAFQTPVWGFTLYKIDGITPYIKGFFFTPKPSNRRGDTSIPRLTLEITIFSNFLEVVSSRIIC